MKNVFYLVSLAIVLVFAGTAFAQGLPDANGVHSLLTCFEGAGVAGFNGTCSSGSLSGKAALKLDTLDGDSDAGNNFAGMYSTENTFIYGKPLSVLGELRFSYSGTAVGGGAPRFSVGVDTDGDTLTDFFVYIAAHSCSDGQGNVSARPSTCRIYAEGGGGPYAGAAGLAKAYPTATVASDVYAFIIADEPGRWALSDVWFGGPRNYPKR